MSTTPLASSSGISSYAALGFGSYDGLAAPFISAGASVQPKLLHTGQTQLVTVVVRSTEYVRSALVDIEVYDQRGLRVFQDAKNVQLSANVPVTVRQKYRVPRTEFAGVYYLKLGVFGTDWKPLYFWNDNAAAFVVRGPVLPRITATGRATPRSVSPGESITLTALLSVQTRDLANVLVDIEVYQGRRRRYQHPTWGVRIPHNGTVRVTAPWTLPATEPGGTYIVKIGVFGSQWTPFYFWNGNAAKFEVSAPG